MVPVGVSSLTWMAVTPKTGIKAKSWIKLLLIAERIVKKIGNRAQTTLSNQGSEIFDAIMII